MPTESEKQAEKERVTRISGFRVGYHDFLAEVDLEALQQRNDRWEVEHRHQSRLDRKTEELMRIAAYVALRNPPHHLQIHVHYLAGCALGVGTVLGDTLARHDRADAAWGFGRGGSHPSRGVRAGKPGVP